MLAIAYSIALFANQYQGTGAVYEYLTRGAHPAVGIFAAGIFFTGTLFLGGGGIYLGLGILTQSFWVGAHLHLAPCPPGGSSYCCSWPLVLVLNPRRADRDRRDATFAAISFTPMLFLAVNIIAKGGANGNTLPGLQPRHNLGATSSSTASCSASCCSSASRPRHRSARRA